MVELCVTDLDKKDLELDDLTVVLINTFQSLNNIM